MVENRLRQLRASFVGQTADEATVSCSRSPAQGVCMRPWNRYLMCLLFLALVWLSLTPAWSAADVIGASTFDTDDEGWRLSGDPTSPIPDWISDGKGGGYIHGTDASLGIYWYY